MKEKTDNEIVAEWMGLFRKYVEMLHYDTSWDWLMPACKKWDELTLNNTEYIQLSDKLDQMVTLYEIVPAFQQLVENIKWYNQQSK